MKKILALLLALVMAIGLCACGGGETAPAEETETPAAETGTEVASADDIPDTMTSEDGKYEVAFVTDVGQLKDKSFNQGTYDGVKLYAAANDLSYKYYQPANGDQATDDDRYEAMKAAVDGGAQVVVCAGFLQEAALTQAAIDFPETQFIFVDGYPVNDADGQPLANVAGIAFQEEQPGYFAGYAAVMDGYTKLGFCGGGGGTNPACCRYGYGFVQGANAAAAEKDVQVEVNYSWQYGASFSASPELQTMATGWYEAGTEVIFACGGSMFQSIASAASASDGAVIGVDVDQSTESDTVITSAMKGLSDAVQWALAKAYDGSFAEIGGVSTSLGVEQNAVGLPTGTWSLETFTVEEYEALYQKIADGTLVVDADFNNLEQEYSNLTLNII
ncbi:MAG: BMP family ABC transporter substrate-binding protein [Clostridiales bacterium]|uniref:BMP family lipoprotein n=1 Tax=Evtepia sp. TaxID=2773933 RepID=UPI0029837020|nr:BMP family ABC transporter substrate-binding protein [Evtepia sp.]MDD7289487.1 BMP family ABC transporter substrate-binding protein [Clostridiales bacterium]MDY3992455.1 BMP family ABC transporter substrate-binding protein [Evtepia sp.]MDY4431046.1 BMP family ABC transporter substrate-binding protein [Evtepia sp.]